MAQPVTIRFDEERFAEAIPDEFRAGWVEIHPYLTLAQRQRIDGAGMGIELDPGIIQEAMESLGEGATAKDLTTATVAKAARISLDIQASEYAETREAVIRYDLGAGDGIKIGGAMLIEELPEELECVVEAIKAHYDGRRRSPAGRKSVGASV